MTLRPGLGPTGMDRTGDRHSTFSKGFTVVWRCALLVAVILFLWPVKYQSTRALLVLLVFFVWIGWLVRWWAFPKTRWVSLATVLLPLIFLILPGRSIDSDRVRQSYVKSLRSFLGKTYVWGGENRLGIDCSGLVRRGLIDALIKEGVFSFNPSTVRQGLFLWWNDTSARALQNQHLGLTQQIRAGVILNDLNHSELRPGDLAVTANGVHIMAYLGGDEWIEADPAFRKVVVLRKGGSDPWLHSEMELLRWHWLQ